MQPVSNDIYRRAFETFYGAYPIAWKNAAQLFHASMQAADSHLKAMMQNRESVAAGKMVFGSLAYNKLEHSFENYCFNRTGGL